MKKYIIFACIAVVVIAGGSVFALAQHRTSDSPKTPAAVQCRGQHASHVVTIKDSIMSPVRTQASLCDTLTITNDDDALRLLAFGPHDHHMPYDGVTEKLLQQGQSLTVTLDQAGAFTFHDHLHDSLVGQFTVHN